MSIPNHHFLLVSCYAQSHINPTLQFAKLLVRAGARVTFVTTVHGLSRIKALPPIHGLSYASFSDGDDDGNKSKADFAGYLADMKRVGSQSLSGLLRSLAGEGRPVTTLIYTVLLSWAAEVARDMQIPSAFLCIQSAAAFAIYHRCFNSHDGLLLDSDYIDPTTSIQVSGLPLFTCDDVPSFLLRTCPFASSICPCFREHIQTLERDPHPCVLVNTFDALEGESIKAVHNMKLIAIGPLIPSAFSDGRDPSDTCFGCDMFERSTGYLEWLDSKPERSVVYVSFGSFVVLEKGQREEMLQGLVESGRPFLWVNRSPESDVEEAIETGVSSEQGLIVRWCSQVEVLCHRSVGCFVTHCGWNSTVESMAAGMAVVAFPQLADQQTNAKMVEEAWGTGVRARVNEEGVLERGEIKRCLEVVMGSGDRGEEIRRSAAKWKSLALEAVKEGGSSHYNLEQFLETMR